MQVADGFLARYVDIYESIAPYCRAERVIRKAYSEEKFESVSDLENWLDEISVFYRLDAAMPGLAEFRRELAAKLERMRSFSLDLETEKVARALDEGNLDGDRRTS